ncbi:MAG: type II secretion system F family protein [Opitutales bacterium]
MPVFAYKAFDATGRSVTGELDAADRRAAVQRLSAQGIRPLHIEQKHHVAQTDDEESETIDFFASDRKVKKEGLFRRKKSRGAISLRILQRLLTLLSAGLSLGDATRLMQQRLTDPELKELSGRLWRHLSEGRTLAAAMATEHRLFSPAQCHLVEAGEASGSLVPVLRRMVRHLEETREVRKRLIASLTYPLIIIGISLVVIGIVVGFLIPQIEKMVDQLGSELFFLAQWLIVASDFALKVGPFLVLGGIIGAVLLSRWRKTTAGRRATDLWALKLPVFGRINLYSNIYSTTNLLGTLLASGVNTTEALRLVERTIPNVVLRAKFHAARKQIQEGVAMSTAIQRVHFMPDLAMDILTVGENTGEVTSSLEEINGVYREELTTRLDRLTGLVAAVALGGAFAIVAVIAFSVAFSVISVSQSLMTR